MEEISYITNDSYAIYVGYTSTCMSCKIRLYEVEKISHLIKEMKFREEIENGEKVQ